MVHGVKLAQIVSQLIYKWFQIGLYIYKLWPVIKLAN